MNTRSFLLAALLLALPGATANADHAINPDSAPIEAVPVETLPVQALPVETVPAAAAPALIRASSRESCRTLFLTPDEIRTDCRSETLPVHAPDPALRGICTTFYGHRTCY